MTPPGTIDPLSDGEPDLPAGSLPPIPEPGGPETEVDFADTGAKCAACGGRGWNLVGENEAAACSCRAGEAWSARDDVADLPTDAGAPARALLELNGYNAIRAQVLGALDTLAAIPPDAYKAALEYNADARARLKVDLDARAGVALDIAQHERALLDTAARLARSLRSLEERRRARNRITQR